MKNAIRFFFPAACAAFAFTTLALAQTPNCTGSVDLFRQKCSMCHAQDGKGYAAIHTPVFTDASWQAKHTDQELIDAVTNGKQEEGKMPAFKGKLTDAQIDSLVKCAVRGFAKKHVSEKKESSK